MLSTRYFSSASYKQMQSISAFQIHVRGVKGIISILDQREHATFNKSMKTQPTSDPDALSFSVPDDIFFDRRNNCFEERRKVVGMR